MPHVVVFKVGGVDGVVLAVQNFPLKGVDVHCDGLAVLAEEGNGEGEGAYYGRAERWNKE